MSYLLLLLVLAHQLFVFYFSGKKIDIFSIYTFIDAILLAMFFLGTNMDPHLKQLINYDFSFFCHVLTGFLGLYLGLHILPYYRKSKNRNFPTPQLQGRLTFFKLAVPVFLFCLPIAIIVREELARTGLSLAEYFTGGRLEDYLDTLSEGKSSPAFWYIIVSATRPVLLFLICYLWDSNRRMAGWIIYFITLAGILLIFKTRLELVITLLVPIAYYHYRIRKLKVKMMLLLVPVAFIGLIALDYWRNMGIKNFSSDQVTVDAIAQSFSRDINAVRGFEKIWQWKREDILEFEYGMNYVYILMTPIPRSMWENKPFTAFEPRWTAKLFENFEGGVWIFTAWGEGLAQFGLIGIFINLMLYGIVIKFALIMFRKPHNSSILVWFYYSVLAATFLRAGFQQVFVMTFYYFLFYSLYRKIMRV